VSYSRFTAIAIAFLPPFAYIPPALRFHRAKFGGMHSMKAMLKRMLRPFYRATRNMLRPIAERIRGPLSGLLYPPEFETVLRNLEQITNNLKAYVDQSDQMLLAMFRTLHLPPAPACSAPFAPINLGNGRILASHPAAAFLYVDANDLHETPRILLGDYRSHITEALRRLIRPGSCCVDLGAGVGFHTLTMAVTAGSGSQCYGIELDAHRASLLRDNVTANDLTETCESFAPSNGSSAGEANRWLNVRLASTGRHPDWVRISGDFDRSAIRGRIADWIEAGATRFLLSSRGGWIAAEEFNALSLWRIAVDGSLFRATRNEIEELGRQQEVHIIAAKALQ
jgi:hypothetical protein